MTSSVRELPSCVELTGQIYRHSDRWNLTKGRRQRLVKLSSKDSLGGAMEIRGSDQ